MKEKEKVILITSVFPPSWGSGVHRISKLYKYLPAFGYCPFVLTTKENSYGVIDYSVNIGLDRRRIIRLPVINWRFFSKRTAVKGQDDIFTIRKGVEKERFHRIAQSLRKLYSGVLIPDDRALWIPLAITEGYRALRREGATVLYSTSPHCSCHIVGLFLNRLTGIPWIADFRDPWVGNPFSTSPSKFRLTLDLFLERQVVKYSSKVLSISEPIVSDLKRRHPQVSSNKFEVLLNSFDPDDLVDLQESKPEKAKFVISHAGTFYGNRSPEPFLKALLKLFEQRPDWRDRIEVLFIGSWPQNGRVLTSLHLLREVIIWVPYLPYKEMLTSLAGSSALLLIPGPGRGTMTGKVFDYIALRKPILLLSQGNSELEKMLRRIGVGFIVPFHDIEKIVDCLTVLIEEFIETGDIKIEANEEEIGLFTSFEMARKLARIMDEVRREG